VATASLELGIDVGEVDLVCQIGSPRSISVALQRIGRSGHSLKGTPKGRLYPLTRDELVETVALVRAINSDNLDTLRIPQWPLDILAQQMVATCVSEDWDEGDLFDLMRRAYPYKDLSPERYEQVVTMLSEGVANRWGRGSALLHRDGVNGRLKARRGARIAAITGGGAIPDTADYSVVAEPEGTFVGTVNEDFAIESMAGDVFLLGNTPWKIRRVESSTVRVESVIGQAPTIPFWLGEAPGRTRELSLEVSDLREAIDQRLSMPDAAIQWLMLDVNVSQEVATQIVEYIVEGKRVLGLVPTATRVVAERFFDEAGGMQLVIHSPLGARINRAWGLALRKRFCRTFDFELQASATDDGINLALGPQHSFLVEETFRYLTSSTAEPALLQAVLASPVFNTRWRWDATRSLALLRRTGGKRVPTNILRMRADDLLAAVFPGQAACQDNQPANMDVEPPDHPLVFETVRDCLTEALDIEGLKETLRAIEQGEIEVHGRDTVQPSVFSHQILNAMPYAFLDDAPLEERRARAVTLRRALPDDPSDLSALDSEAIRFEAVNAWPTVRDPDELHDAMLTLGVVTEQEVRARADDPSRWQEWFTSLVEAGRAVRVYVNETSVKEDFWVATERLPLVCAVYPAARLDPEPRQRETTLEQEEALVELVRGRSSCIGPFTVEEMAQTLRMPAPPVKTAVIQLEVEGLLLRGRFRPRGMSLEDASEEFCDRRILARIHHSTISKLRREIEPVPAATFIRFLQEWQHATPGTRLSGEAGVIEVIDQLQGFEAAAVAWEEHILPQRVADYTPSMLDHLCFSGEVAWGRFARREIGQSAGSPLSKHGPVSLALREDLPLLLDSPLSEDGGVPELTGAAGEVLEYLSAHGASFVPDIAGGTHRLPYEVEEALWQLVAAGLVTADGFSALRGLVSGLKKRVQRSSRFQRGPRQRIFSSRWSLLQSGAPRDDVPEARAAQLLRRYGVVIPELLAREPMAGSWRPLVQVLRRAEARGELRGGRFLAGFVGEQYALPEAVDMLRALRKREASGEEVHFSACDPLNVAGILTPGPRVTAVPGNSVVFKDGVPVGGVGFATGAEIGQQEPASRQA